MKTLNFKNLPFWLSLSTPSLPKITINEDRLVKVKTKILIKTKTINTLKYKSLLSIFMMISLSSCYKLINIKNETPFKTEFQKYNIYKGNPADLIPTDSYQPFELTTTLFTDYAEKQRLIKLPKGKKMIANGNGLPLFPDSTILVKTFYYFNDKTDKTKGKYLLETRIMIKEKERWSVDTYVWNEEQTNATLQLTGSDIPVIWVDELGKSNSINYHIPSHTECTSCHQKANNILPIGPKLRNLNIDVTENGISENQLLKFQNMGLINNFGHDKILKLPDWENANNSLSDRARAYFDVNCAHCHNSEGMSAKTKLLLDFETTADNSRIKKRKNFIISRMNASSNRMPKLGTTVIHEEGLELVKQYLKTL